MNIKFGDVVMKIYTGTGDRGKTSLFSGERVEKTHSRIEACGELDELNSYIGMVIGMLPEDASGLQDELKEIQSNLFQTGAWISTVPPYASGGQLKEIDRACIGAIEKAIDRMEEQLPPLRGFIFPGGHPSSALTHVARAVCRRTERRLVALHETDRSAPEPQLEIGIMLLNRLSDYLFVLARYLNHHEGISESLWKK